MDTPTTSNCEEEIDDVLSKSEGTVKENLDTDSANVKQSPTPTVDQLITESDIGAEDKKGRSYFLLLYLINCKKASINLMNNI